MLNTLQLGAKPLLNQLFPGARQGSANSDSKKGAHCACGIEQGKEMKQSMSLGCFERTCSQKPTLSRRRRVALKANTAPWQGAFGETEFRRLHRELGQ